MQVFALPTQVVRWIDGELNSNPRGYKLCVGHGISPLWGSVSSGQNCALGLLVRIKVILQFLVPISTIE